MSTATVFQKRKVVNNTNNRQPFRRGLEAMNQQKKGWAISKKTELQEVVNAFFKRCERENLTTETTRTYKLQFETRLLPFFHGEKGFKNWEDITYASMDEFIRAMQSSDYANASKVQFLRAMKTLFRWMQNDHELKHSYQTDFLPLIPKIGKVEGRTWIPSPVEMQTFLHSFDQDVYWGYRDFIITSLILETGARAGEICNMTPDFIHWQTNMVTLVGKTGKRTVPVSADMISILKKWMSVRAKYVKDKGNGMDRVFITRNGGKLTVMALDKQFEKHRDKTGVGNTDEGNISPHVVRHYFCTYYLVNGGHIQNLQRITGHSDLETLMIYVHLANQLTTIADEQSKVSPLKNLSKNAGQTPTGKKVSKPRRMS